MSDRIDRFVHDLTEKVKEWQGVDSVGLVRSGDDRYDPYFFVSLDVYCNDVIPDATERSRIFGDVAVFESSLMTRKDRFLVDDIPVRLEYKQTSRFDELICAAGSGNPIFRDSGTYAFHRLQTAQVLFARSDWIDRVREQIATLPESFWTQLRHSQQARAEHVYSDLSAASAREDPLFFSISSGRLVTSICSLLFTINRCFEPSNRHLVQELPKLRSIPDSFPANLSNFVRQENLLSMGQRRELAELMITRVFSL